MYLKVTHSENKDRKRILFLTSRFPWPLEKGDKLRAYHFIKALSLKADIYLFAINETYPSQEQLQALVPYCKEIKCCRVSKFDSVLSVAGALIKSIPFQAAYFYNSGAVRELKKFIASFPVDAMFCHLLRMGPYAASINIHPSVIDYMDAFSKGMERYAATAPFWIKPAAAAETRRLAVYERELFDQFDSHTVISAQDRDCIAHPDKSDIVVLPNGVDLEYYSPMDIPKKQELIFLGNMAYAPNIASVNYAVRKILPELDKLIPGCRLLIAGATPGKEVLDLASDRVMITGWLDDVRESMASSCVMIAPMLISIGLQNKILQAMSMKIPCVVSSLANNAIGAVHNESILVADTPAEYAAQIARLLRDEQLRLRIAENAHVFVRQNFSWDAAVGILYRELGINN